jgi:hypothetical protein
MSEKFLPDAEEAELERLLADPRVHEVPDGLIGPPEIMREIIRLKNAEHEAALRAAEKLYAPQPEPNEPQPEPNEDDDDSVTGTDRASGDRCGAGRPGWDF